jgi:hypothetical protein
MMARMGVQKSASPEQRPVVASCVPALVPASHPACESISQVVEVSSPEEYLPRSQAPEKGSDMAAMRAVANTATTAAIKSHARRRRIMLSARTSVVAILSLLGATAISAAWIVYRAPIAQFGATFFFVLGIGCVFKAMLERFRPW